jgi:hypothetical protein
MGMMRNRRDRHPSAKRELSLAAADEVKHLLGSVSIDVFEFGEVEVSASVEDGEQEGVLVRALWALAEVAKQLGTDGDDEV